MDETNINKTDVDQEKLELERRRLELEELKFNYAKDIDEKRLKSERLAKLWSQFSLLTPIIILLVGFFLNSYTERAKRTQDQNLAAIKEKRQFIEKQLAEFYYPIQLRLNKDRAWLEKRGDFRKAGDVNIKIALKLQEVNNKIALKLEEEFMLPNHLEITKIIDAHFDLIKNDSDKDKKLNPLMEAMKEYVRHVAVLKALMDVGDHRQPVEVGVPYPKEFLVLIDNRIADLEKQRNTLLEKQRYALPP